MNLLASLAHGLSDWLLQRHNERVSNQTPEQAQARLRKVFADIENDWRNAVRRERSARLGPLIHYFLIAQLRTVDANLPGLLEDVGTEEVARHIFQMIYASGTHGKEEITAALSWLPSDAPEKS
jgi:hypothetical protein